MSKEDKIAKKEAKAEKSIAKAKAKAEKKHAKAYDKFVKGAEKKNQKAAAAGKDLIVIPPIDEFQTKGEIKTEKALQKSYAAYVKKLEKKNAKNEAKCAKKGKPFVPVPIPTYEEYITGAASQGKAGKIILMIILLLLIWLLIYFIVMYSSFAYNPFQPESTTAEDDGTKIPAVYESYVNPHEITTTPDYSVDDAKRYLKQTLHDNWGQLGYSSDPSDDAISYNNRIVKVNGADCYIFSASGATYAVSVKLSACYYSNNGEYVPLTFNDTDILF